MKVGLLGGTFDPPHLGHLQMARVALWSGQVDKVAFLPCWKHAFGKEPSEFEHRVAMCESMLLDEGDNRIVVWKDEEEIKSAFSIEILEAIHHKHPDVEEFRLILGADNYWKIGKWEQPDRVRKLAKPLWVDRPGQSRIPEESLVCNLDISSSKIRYKIRNALLNDGITEDVFLDDISPRVLDYIKKYGLYKKEE